MPFNGYSFSFVDRRCLYVLLWLRRGLVPWKLQCSTLLYIRISEVYIWFYFPPVLWQCYFGDGKDIWSVKPKGSFGEQGCRKRWGTGWPWPTVKTNAKTELVCVWFEKCIDSIPLCRLQPIVSGWCGVHYVTVFCRCLRTSLANSGLVDRPIINKTWHRSSTQCWREWSHKTHNVLYICNSQVVFSPSLIVISFYLITLSL